MVPLRVAVRGAERIELGDSVHMRVRVRVALGD